MSEERGVLPNFRARGIMSSPPITISSDNSVEDAAKLMLDRNIGAVIVVDAAGNYVGLLTERDFMPERSLIPFMRGEVFRVMGVQVEGGGAVQEAIDKNRDRRLAEVVDIDAPVARPDSTASELAVIMLNHEVNHVPVVEDDRPVGMVSRHDFLRMFATDAD